MREREKEREARKANITLEKDNIPIN